MPSACLICNRTSKHRASGVSFHRFPPKSEAVKCKQWLLALGLTESEVADHHRVCSEHFPNGDCTQLPSLYLGERFRSPKKIWTARGQRAAKRKSTDTGSRAGPSAKRHLQYSTSPATIRTSSDRSDEEDFGTSTALSTPIGEVLLSDYSVHELPSECSEESTLDTSGISGSYANESSTNVIVHTALVARIEALEIENKALHRQVSCTSKPFRLSIIAHSDSLVHFYTGFQSYDMLLTFFDFLGPVVNHLEYWGSKETVSRKRKTKLDPLNQFFVTLIKLRLNLREKDIALRFGVAASTISKYFITCISFLHKHLSELQWTPTLEQVKRTLPEAFREKFPDTYAIIDASEVFIKTPCDLQYQSSTWSNYKHHNTAKFIVACTPNGAISFVSPLYVGSISDVELTHVSGFIESLSGKTGVSIMADRGFTISDQLAPHGIKLNIPPFMEGRAQLSAEDVRKGRKIASVRIHVERAIGRIKNFTILKGTLPISISRIANQIVQVCAWLVNFQPVLIPPPSGDMEEVDTYFANLTNEESDYDADTELSDEEI